jgi:ubiquinone/menaquinone biosynthesis C-methylase UbiE
MSLHPSTTSPLSALAREHLDAVASFYDSSAGELTTAARSYRRRLAHYFNLLIPADASVLEIGCGDGELLAHLNARNLTGIDISAKQLEQARQRLPHATFLQQAGEELDLPGKTFDYIIVSDTLNFAADVEQLLERLHTVATPQTRLLVNFHNNLWYPAFKVASWLGLQSKQPQSSWLSRHDVASLLALAGWDVIKNQPRLLWPIRTPLLAPLLNRWLAPLFPWACCSIFTIARPRPALGEKPLSVSVVVPARNEAGNIEAAVQRTPLMGAWTELIFVEGNSTDQTWAEIQRVKAAYPDRRIKILQQPGRGKGDAVRAGYAVAEGDVLMILDADLTMPPEELPKFYHAIASGRAEFANGSRLVYPMEKQAMQFLNMIANHCFGHAFSWMLGQRVKDTLCGTKVLRRDHYLKIAANRAYFGEFDPFGDFDLLFGADKLNLKVVDIPIRYRERTYGSTNIQRWKHGWLLLRMVAFAARKLKFI